MPQSTCRAVTQAMDASEHYHDNTFSNHCDFMPTLLADEVMVWLLDMARQIDPFAAVGFASTSAGRMASSSTEKSARKVVGWIGVFGFFRHLVSLATSETADE